MFILNNCTPEYRHQDDHQQLRQSPSPTHNGFQSSRTPYDHKRRDSDTLRNGPSSSGGLSSPTVVAPNRGSPPGSRLHVRHSPPGVVKGRVSPSSLKGRETPSAAAVKERTSPPGLRGRLLPPPAGNAGRESGRHRRSPTAPEPPTTSAMMDKKEREREKEFEKQKELERERKWQQMQQQPEDSAAPPESDPAIPQASGPAPPPPSQLNRHIVV